MLQEKFSLCTFDSIFAFIEIFDLKKYTNICALSTVSSKYIEEYIEGYIGSSWENNTRYLLKG